MLLTFHIDDTPCSQRVIADMLQNMACPFSENCMNGQLHH